MSLEDSAYDMAETYLTQAIEKFTQLNDKRMLVFSLNEMAHTAAHQGKQDKAIRLLGYGQTLVASYHLKLHAQANRRYQAIYDTLKASTSDDNFQRLWQQGEAMAQGKVITALL
jgi:hypothetical protein